MPELLSSLRGKKTYLVALAMFVWALVGYFGDKLGGEEASKLLLEALGLAALRSGMKKK